tara:strand:+ start:137 stop:841 length:705 start_codon:yes stop_codon:yes gene_type:complete
MEKLKDIAPLYFQEESSSIFMMDCVSAMKNYPDNYFDLAVVDPPYGIGESKNVKGRKGVLAKKSNYKIKDWDNESPNDIYFKELQRVSKNQIIWGANHFISKIPFNSSCWVVWDKQNGENDFADCELAFTSFKTSVRKFEFRWQGMLQGDMKNKEQRIHPTQKPVALYDWIFKNYAETGMKVLDTHLGSGSSRIAAHKAGMDFTGFEIDEDYFRASNKRFKDYHSQLTLFSHVS